MKNELKLRGGIDLGGTKIQAVVIDGEHRILGQVRCATPSTGGPRDVVQAMALILRESANQAGVETAELVGVGVGSPGFVDDANGTVARAGNLPNWQHPFRLAAVLSEAVGSPVHLGNDVGVALDAEAHLGAGKDFESFIGVWWGTGIGGGVVLRHERWLGRGASGEIGHMVIKRNGAKCPCGRRGCVEAYAGRRAIEAKARRDVKRGAKTALFEIMKKQERTQLSSGVFAKAIAKRDEYTLELLDRAVCAIGAGVASACNLLDVEAVVIGGGLGTRLGKPYAEKIRGAMLPHLFLSDRPPKVLVAALGDFSGAIGASLLVPGAKDLAAGERSAAKSRA